MANRYYYNRSGYVGHSSNQAPGEGCGVFIVAAIVVAVLSSFLPFALALVAGVAIVFVANK